MEGKFATTSTWVELEFKQRRANVSLTNGQSVIPVHSGERNFGNCNISFFLNAHDFEISLKKNIDALNDCELFENLYENSEKSRNKEKSKENFRKYLP